MRTLPLRECTDRSGMATWPVRDQGLRYAYRVHGPEGPATTAKRGQRFDSRRLLLDPYAREVAGRFPGGSILNRRTA
jgi:glycogen operon protein